MMKSTLTDKQKEADSDLNIIVILTILSFIGYILFQKQILDFSHQQSFPSGFVFFFSQLSSFVLLDWGRAW